MPLGFTFGLKKTTAKKAAPKIKGPKNKKAISTMKNIIKFTKSKNFNHKRLAKYNTNNLLYAITAVSGPRTNYNRNNNGVWFIVQNQSNLTKNRLINNIGLMGPNMFVSNLNNYKKTGSQYNFFLKRNFPNRK